MADLTKILRAFKNLEKTRELCEKYTEGYEKLRKNDNTFDENNEEIVTTINSLSYMLYEIIKNEINNNNKNIDSKSMLNDIVIDNNIDYENFNIRDRYLVYKYCNMKYNEYFNVINDNFIDKLNNIDFTEYMDDEDNIKNIAELYKYIFRYYDKINNIRYLYNLVKQYDSIKNKIDKQREIEEIIKDNGLYNIKFLKDKYLFVTGELRFYDENEHRTVLDNLPLIDAFIEELLEILKSKDDIQISDPLKRDYRIRLVYFDIYKLLLGKKDEIVENMSEEEKKELLNKILAINKINTILEKIK